MTILKHRHRLALAGTFLFFCGPAFAGNCIGTVYGLAKKQDAATGAGFLAIRSAPDAAAPMLGKLVNGDRFDVGRTQGDWIYVLPADLEGWAWRHRIRVKCP